MFDISGLNHDDEAHRTSESKTNETQVSQQTEQKPKLKKGRNPNQPELKAPLAGSSSYSRVIPIKRNTSYDSKSDNQAFDEKKRDQGQKSYEWFETQMDRVDKKNVDTHSGANFQNLMVNLAAKKVTQPSISGANTKNILEFTRDNQSFCDTIDRHYPNCNFINLQSREDDGNGGEMRRN